MVKNGYKSVFAYLELVMDFFDERIFAALKDGKPRSLNMLPGEVGFSHNTLQQHPERLVAQSLVVREKATSNSSGRPKFTDHVPSRDTKQVTASLQNPYVALVAAGVQSPEARLQVREGRISKQIKNRWKP